MTSNKSNGASFKDLYELVERSRVELKQDMVNMVATLSQNQGELKKSFDELEAGRLTRAEGYIKDLQVSNATVNTKMAIVVFLAAGVVSAIISVIVSRTIK